jgi:uncharacterized protein with HEPN domain
MITIDFIKSRNRDDLDNDQMLSLALVRLIEIIGEAANNISLSCQNNYPQIPWREMIGMRNRIVHAYFEVDLDVVWQVIIDDLPRLLRWINQAIQDLE